MQRKSAILLAANAHFAHFGFRGASLRDIARDAGVSLTLLNHHFGSKFQLLVAVIDAHQNVLDDRATALRQLMAEPGGFTVRDMVTSWVRLGFETASQPDGELFMRLVARVIDDPEEEAVKIVRERLDDGALQFIDALMRCYPGASRYDAVCAYQCFNASLLKFLIGSRRLLRLAQAAAPGPASAAMPAFASRPAGIAVRPALETASDDLDSVEANGDEAVATATSVPTALAASAPAVSNLREDDQERVARFAIAGIETLMEG